MKKFLVAMLFAFAGNIAAMAGDDIKLTEGSIASLSGGGVGCVSIDMKDTQFDSKKPLRQDDRFRNIDDDLPECTREFVREFNDNSKKFKLTETAADAQYEFLVNITNLDTYIKVMSFKGGVGIKVWGNVTIKDKANGNTVAVYAIDEYDNSGFTYQIAVEETFEGIAKFLAKRIKKGK